MSHEDDLVQEWFDRFRPPVGQRLPAERVLAETLGLSRAALRKGLATLERRGLLLRQVGRGTFVQSAARTDGKAAHDVAGLDVSPRQVIQARLALEPGLARMAAREGSSARHRAIEEAERAVTAASDWQAWDRSSSAFRRAIALACGNPLLVRLFDEMAAAAAAMTWGRLRSRNELGFQRSESTLRDHAAIRAAILDRDVDEAGEAMRRHVLVDATALVTELV